MCENPMDFIKDIGDEANNNNGISSIWLANHLYVVLTEPNDMEKVLLNCLEKDDVVRLAEPLLHNSSLISSASLWRPRRKILVSVFGQKLLNNFVNIFQKQSGILLNELKALGEMNNLPIFKYLSSCTMGALCESTLGVNVNSKNNINHPFVPAFHKFCEDTLFRFCNPLLHSITIFKMMPSYSKYIENINVLIDFTDELIKLKRQEISKGNDSIQTHASGDNVKGKSALELLLMTSGPDNNYTDVELREELLTAILAGTDTSAVGASFVLLMLAKYPDIQEKVFQEIMYIRKNGDNTIDAEDLPRLVYLDAVIKETLRLYPPVPSISRKIMKHVTLPLLKRKFKLPYNSLGYGRENRGDF
ncbi:cytochrome P450 4C1-like [Aphomia sociella]